MSRGWRQISRYILGGLWTRFIQVLGKDNETFFWMKFMVTFFSLLLSLSYIHIHTYISWNQFFCFLFSVKFHFMNLLIFFSFNSSWFSFFIACCWIFFNFLYGPLWLVKFGSLFPFWISFLFWIGFFLLETCFFLSFGFLLICFFF